MRDRVGPSAVDPSVPVVVLGIHHGSLGIARSLGRLGIAVYGVTGDPRLPASCSRYFRETYAWDLDHASGAETVAFLGGVVERIGRRPILIATTDASSLFVAEYADALANQYRFASVPAALVRSFSDKRELFHLARRLGIPTPSVVFPRCLEDVHHFLTTAVFPVVLKGIDGTRLQARHGKKMVIVHSAPELLDRYVELEDPVAPNLMLQEYIPGGDDTIWMFNGYFDRASQCVAAFTGKKLRQHPVHAGATSLGITLRNETVEALTTAFMGAVGYKGILDIGYRYDARDGSYKLLDPNPRIGSTFRLFVDANGMDVVRFLYLDMTDQPLPKVVPREGRKWIVEDQDVEACLDYRREGQLRLGEWMRSLRGIDEAAWFAYDDLKPFWRMSGRLARRAVRWLVRRAGTAARRLRVRRVAGRDEVEQSVGPRRSSSSVTVDVSTTTPPAYTVTGDSQAGVLGAGS